MCGIFGVIFAGDLTLDRDLARGLTLSLLQFSQTRGREAAGIAIHDGEHIEVFRQGGSVADFLANPELHALLDTAFDTYDRRRQAGNVSALAIVGHSRLATNGSQSNGDNNQPVITRGAVALSVDPSAGATIRGPAGSRWLSVALPVSRRAPSAVTPSKL